MVSSISKKLKGFTLIEVLIAMTLLSIMVVLLFSSLKIGAESWDKGEKKIAEVNEKAVIYHFFKRHLPSIRPLWDDFSKGKRRLSFQGSREALQFVSVFPASAGRKGVQLFEIALDKKEKNLIKIKLKPFYPPAEGSDWKLEEVDLLENVETFKLSYFGQTNLDSEASWTDNWTEKDYLPSLIKINITLVDQSYWPEMVFALELAGLYFGDSQEFDFE